jgi:uncharacterized membrane-anchored protein YjiN (DUF445 family)
MDFVSLEIAKNAAMNGRLFCLMIFAVNLAAFVTGYGDWYARLAVMCAVPLGMSVITDWMSDGHAKDVMFLATVALAIIVAAVTFFSAW